MIMMMDAKTLVLVVTAVASASTDWHWSYNDELSHEPSHWAEHYQDCGGFHQSPVDLREDRARYDPSYGPVWYSYSCTITEDCHFTLKNNGHAVQVDVTGGYDWISRGRLPASYNLAQFHFHWGSKNNKGSEHLVNGKQYPMEIHLVHYNTDYSSLAEAADKPQGLAVIGAFFKISSNANPVLQDLVNNLANVAYKNDSIEIEPFNLLELFPHSPNDYFRYEGSLTTPGCYESVIWTVIKHPIRISKSQMDAFRRGLKQGGHRAPPLVNNYRPVQPLNSRVVHVNF